MYDDKETEAREALTLIAEVEAALANGTRHYRRSDGKLLINVMGILRTLRDEKVIELEPAGKKEATDEDGHT